MSESFPVSNNSNNHYNAGFCWVGTRGRTISMFMFNVCLVSILSNMFIVFFLEILKNHLYFIRDSLTLHTTTYILHMIDYAYLYNTQLCCCYASEIERENVDHIIVHFLWLQYRQFTKNYILIL